MRLVVISIVIISLLCGTYLPCYANSSQAVYGDINLDGDLKVNDARLALRGALELEELTDAQIFAGDIDFDGKITLYDARAILKLALDMSIEKPTQKPT